METCKYHPRNSSRWYCERCDAHYCNQCVEKDLRHNSANCFSCGGRLNRRSSSEYIPPFWKQLSQIHRYPLSSTPLVAMILTSVLAGLLPQIGLPGLVALFLLAILYLGYCSDIMIHTADGNLKHPVINQFFGADGRRLVALQFFFFIAVGVVNYALTLLLGIAGAYIASILPFLIFPAALIAAVVDRSFLSMINPLRLLGIVFAIGPAYPLLLIFLFLIGVSQEVATSIVGAESTFGLMVCALVICYFTMVMYHLIGYAIFQYHDDLGHLINLQVTDDHDGEGTTDVDIACTNAINRAAVLIKEGRPKEAAGWLFDAAQRFPSNIELQDMTFKVLAKTGSQEQRLIHGEAYVNLMIGGGHMKKAALAFIDLVRLDKDFKPGHPDRYNSLARLLQQLGKPRAALQLLNEFNEYFPDHPDEIQNYLLAVEILLGTQPDSPVIDSVLNYLEDGEDDDEVLKQVAMLRARAARIRGKQVGQA